VPGKLIFIKTSQCAKIRVCNSDKIGPEEAKMPIYEYWCGSCQRKISVYKQDFSSTASCPRCGNNNLKRVFSTFAMHKTTKDVYEDILSDRELTQGMMRNEPRAMAEWNKRMTGGEKSHPEYEEITDRMERGEWPLKQLGEKRKEFFGEEPSKPETSD
jgi:putative FmdB family regulatory protein